MEEQIIQIETQELESLYKRIKAYDGRLGMSEVQYNAVENNVGWISLKNIIDELFKQSKNCNELIEDSVNIPPDERSTYAEKVNEALDKMEEALTSMEIMVKSMFEVKAKAAYECGQLYDTSCKLQEQLLDIQSQLQEEIGEHNETEMEYE